MPKSGYFHGNSQRAEIAYGVANNLPVLLIGETGIGKTLSVRYLAWKTNNGLRRVNLSGANISAWS